VSGDLFRYEAGLHRAGFALVAGADEAGRGACAGPLVAAAVILEPGDPLEGLADSKALSPVRREALYEVVTARAVAWSVVTVDAADCDRWGIQEADLQALRRAVLYLDPAPDFALTDGFPVAGLGRPGLALWKGDQVAACVAAASIVAKVSRDRIMVAADAAYPGYGFAVHKGYCTQQHQQALLELGPCPLHRRTFATVVSAVEWRDDPAPAGETLG